MVSKMFSIGQMAHLFGLSRQTLIYYDRIGLFKPAEVNQDAYRLYLPTQVPTLRLICLLKDLGLELKEIRSVLETRNPDAIMSSLLERCENLDKRMQLLQAQKQRVVQRINFYRDVAEWRAQADMPLIRHYEERFAVFEPFPPTEHLNRDVLHPTLMRSMQKFRERSEGVPVEGFGTKIKKESFHGENLYTGAGTFVVIPEDVDPTTLSDVTMLSEGQYACMSYWGMPYDGYGIKRLLAWIQKHNFQPAGDAFDFCLFDTTSYDDLRRQDFCCLQIPLAF